SVDFQFAISVSDNASFFNVQQKGEGLTKAADFLLKADNNTTGTKPSRTALQIARDSLEQGIGAYDLTKRYEQADQLFRNTKEYMEQNNLTGEIVYLRTLSNIGLVSLTRGRINEADSFIVKSLAVSEEMLGKKSAAYIANRNNYAKLAQTTGNYNQAERDFDEALSLADALFGESMQKAIVLNNKAMLFQAVGRFDEASALMQKAIQAASSKTGGKKLLFGGFDNRKFKVNLAYIYQVSGNYTGAEKIFVELKKEYETSGTARNADYASLINQMGILYIQMGKPEQVEALLKKAKEIYKARYTEDNVYYAKVCNDLGNFYRMNNRYEEAAKELNKALSINESLLGLKHPDYVRTQENLAILYWKTNKHEQAYMMYRDVMDKTIDFINQYFPPMSEAEKTSYWDVTAPRFQRFYSFALEVNPAMPYVAQDFYDYQMATKALLLNSTSKVKESILKSNNESLIKDYLSWLDQKEQLARLYTLSKEELKQQKINLAELERAANAAEKSLSEKSTEFSQGYSTQKISYKQILGLLTDTEAVVDIIRVRGFVQDFTGESKYVALILKKGMEMPNLVVLDNGAD
ncbi:MAG TPA: tetratricopeptide repeat protein, partial [Cyclobacteriaceae bacterium]|nr:tetratricopeptide repeat protein [Cyclobacteriaceae bacterium]